MKQIVKKVAPITLATSILFYASPTFESYGQSGRPTGNAMTHGAVGS
jgi:hypothetical protein